jgi:hypothetical protein
MRFTQSPMSTAIPKMMQAAAWNHQHPKRGTSRGRLAPREPASGGLGLATLRLKLLCSRAKQLAPSIPQNCPC